METTTEWGSAASVAQIKSNAQDWKANRLAPSAVLAVIGGPWIDSSTVLSFVDIASVVASSRIVGLVISRASFY
jgi:hypothetical protein